MFGDFVQGAITVGNREDVASCFRLAEKYYREGNGYLQNAIGVSFVEHLELPGPILRREYLQLVKAGMAESLPYL